MQDKQTWKYMFKLNRKLHAQKQFLMCTMLAKVQSDINIDINLL